MSSTLRPRRRPQPAPPISLAAVTLMTAAALIALSSAPPFTVRAVAAAVAACSFAWCRATLHTPPRWTTRRIVWLATRNTVGAVVEAGAREARLLAGPPRGRRAVGSSRHPAGAV